MIELTLPWPSPILSPNSRVHHMARARAAREARSEAWSIVQSEHGGKIFSSDRTNLPISFTFYPPDARHYDTDGIYSRLKAAQDGIADALAIDDRLFRPVTIDWGEITLGGKVVVRIG